MAPEEPSVPTVAPSGGAAAEGEEEVPAEAVEEVAPEEVAPEEVAPETGGAGGAVEEGGGTGSGEGGGEGGGGFGGIRPG